MHLYSHVILILVIQYSGHVPYNLCKPPQAVPVVPTVRIVASNVPVQTVDSVHPMVVCVQVGGLD